MYNPELSHAPPEMDPEGARRLTLLFDGPADFHPEATFSDGMARMRLGKLERRGQEFDQRIAAAETYEEKLALAAEKAALAQEYRRTAPRWSHAYDHAAESRNSTERTG
jgi:hypothetical protein